MPYFDDPTSPGFRTIEYRRPSGGQGRIRIPLGGQGISNRGIGIGFARDLYSRLADPLPPLSAPRASSAYNGYSSPASVGDPSGLVPLGYGRSAAAPRVASFTSSFSGFLSNARQASGTASFLTAPLGIAAAALGSPQFNSEVFIPSVSVGLGLNLGYKGAASLIQGAAKSNLFGFSRAGQDQISLLKGIQLNSTLRNGVPYKLPSFGFNTLGGAVTGAASIYTAKTIVDNSFSTNPQSRQYANSAAGGLLLGTAGSYLGGGLGLALTGNPAIGAYGSIAGSLLLGTAGSALGGSLPLSQSLRNVGAAQVQTQAFRGSGLNLLVENQNVLQKLASPLATLLDASFVAGPITEYPKTLAGLPTRADIGTRLNQYGFDARSGTGLFKGSGLSRPERFAAVAFNQSEGIGGTNELFRSQGIGGYNARNSLPEAVQNVRRDLYSALKDKGLSNREVATQKAIFEANVSAAYAEKASRFDALAAAQEKESKTPLIQNQFKVPGATGNVLGGLFSGVYGRTTDALGRPLTRSGKVIPSPKQPILRAARKDFGFDLVNAIGSDLSTGVNNVLAVAGAILNPAKRATGAKEVSETRKTATLLRGISEDAANTVQELTGGGPGQGGGYSGGPRFNPAATAYYQAKTAQIARQDARAGRQDYERLVSTGGKLIAAQGRAAYAGVTQGDYSNLQFDYRAYNAQVPFDIGSVSPEEFRQQAGSAYDQQLNLTKNTYANQINDLTREKLEKTQIFKETDSRFASAIASARTPQAKAELELNRVNNLENFNKTIARSEQAFQKLNKQIAELTDSKTGTVDQSFASFVRQSVGEADRQGNYFRQGVYQTRLSVIRDQKAQLQQELRLGLASPERFLVQDAALDRQGLTVQAEGFRQNAAIQLKSVQNIAAGLREKGATEAADQLLSSFSAYQTEQESAIQTGLETFDPTKINRQALQLRGQALSKKITPFVGAFVSGGIQGKDISTSLNRVLSAAVTGLISSALGDLGATLSAKFLPAGQSFSPGVRGIGEIVERLTTKAPSALKTSLSAPEEPSLLRTALGLGGFAGVKEKKARRESYLDGGLISLDSFTTGLSDLKSPDYLKPLRPSGEFAKPAKAGKPGVTADQFASAATSAAFGYAAGSVVFDQQNPVAGQAAAAGLSVAGFYAGRSIGKKVGGAKGASKGGDIGAAVGAFAGSAAGAFGGKNQEGAATGALVGAGIGGVAGFLIGGPGGAVLGAAIGGAVGGVAGSFFPSKKARQAKRAKEAAERQQGKAAAQSYFSAADSYIGSVFSGYGDYDQRINELNQFTAYDGLRQYLKANNITGNTKSGAVKEYNRIAPLFGPLSQFINSNEATLRRPGAFQGALYDEDLKTQISVAGKSPFSSEPYAALVQNFGSLRASLGEYGFDSQRASLASDLFQKNYQNQLSVLNDSISTGTRDLSFLTRGNQLSATSRGIQGDALTYRANTFERDSRYQIEDALGTLQRRENRAGIVNKLKEQQAFDRDQLTRSKDLFFQQSGLAGDQEAAGAADASKRLSELVDSRTILIEGFRELAPQLVDASQEFYKLSENVKEVNRQIELLGRNLR